MREIRKPFLTAVLPSMLAFAFSGIYAIVDGLFVGRNVGDIGLAAINVSYPIAALIQAIGTGIGMGGAIQAAIAAGRDDEKAQRDFLKGTAALLLLACILATGLLFFTRVGLLRLFGAQGELLAYADSYIRIIVLGAACQILGTGLVPLIRNHDGALAAMAAMMAGFFTNLLLDWMFVSIFGWGVAGAAVATVAGQAVTMVCCLIFLACKRLYGAIKKGNLRVGAGKLKRILVTGLSPFGLTLSPNLVIVILNRGAVVFGGEQAVSCYAVVSYMICVAQLLLQGVGDGCQPLLSRYYGAGDRARMRAVRRLAYGFAFGTAGVCILLLFILRRQLPRLFGASPETVEAVARTLPIFLAGLVFAPFLRITTSCFYAEERNGFAYALIYGEPFLLAVLVAFALPWMLGVWGVWTAVPVTQGSLFLAGLWLFRRAELEAKPAEHCAALDIQAYGRERS